MDSNVDSNVPLRDSNVDSNVDSNMPLGDSNVDSIVDSNVPSGDSVVPLGLSQNQLCVLWVHFKAYNVRLNYICTL